MKRKTKPAAIGFFLSLAILFSNSPAFPDSDIPDILPDQREDVDSQNLDTAIDKAIKVLTVVREELKTEEKTAPAKAVSSVEEESAAEVTGKLIGRINRIWKNIKRAVADETSPGSADDEKDVIDAKEISGRIGEAIEMMTAIKSELEKGESQQKE